MAIEDLARYNPWWNDPRWHEEDIHLEELRESEIEWTPLVVDGLTRDRVYTLRGPRQVGKTTSVKSLVRALLASATDPRSVLYYSCDLVPDARGITGVVREHSDWVRPFRLDERWVLLDEVSSVPDWAKGIKALHDQGLLRKAVTLLTGSHALDVKSQAERLPGRRGEGKAADPLDRAMLPMSFRGYLRAAFREHRDLVSARGELLNLASGGAPGRAVATQLALQKEHRRRLDEYLLCGGFPRAVSAYRRAGRIPREIFELHSRAVIGDVVRWGGGESAAREVLAAVIDALGNPVSWRTLAAKTSLGSHNTVERYVEAMRDSFALIISPHVDLGSGTSVPRKERKIHFSDPFVFHSLRAWSLGIQDPYAAAVEYLASNERKGRVLETVVAAHMARPEGEGIEGLGEVFHWRSGHGEVDAVALLGRRHLAIQVTASEAPRPTAFSPLRAFRDALVITYGAERLTGDVRVLPAAVFLACWA
jgi:hypothetical protein